MVKGREIRVLTERVSDSKKNFCGCFKGEKDKNTFMEKNMIEITTQLKKRDKILKGSGPCE